MSKHDMAADFNPSVLVVAQNAADAFRGRTHSSEYKNHLQQRMFSIYEKGGKLIPVTHVYKKEDGNVEGSARMTHNVMRSMEGAVLVVPNVTYEMVDRYWNHNNDGSLRDPAEAFNAIGKILPAIVADASKEPALQGSRVPEKQHNRYHPV